MIELSSIVRAAGGIRDMIVPDRVRVQVSVVIPAHDAAATLVEQLESLRAQTFQGWEAVIVDEGSSDGTAVLATSFVEAVGGFAPSLRTCEDWDLWQRVARTGARFGVVREVLALYCMQPASASVDGPQMLADGLRVITQGHAPDRRVPNPHPAYADG